jgi:hypothetical protein
MNEATDTQPATDSPRGWLPRLVRLLFGCKSDGWRIVHCKWHNERCEVKREWWEVHRHVIWNWWQPLQVLAGWYEIDWGTLEFPTEAAAKEAVIQSIMGLPRQTTTKEYRAFTPDSALEANAKLSQPEGETEL